MGKTAGFAVKTYRYYNAADKSLDFDGLVQDVQVFKSLTDRFYTKPAQKNDFFNF